MDARNPNNGFDPIRKRIEAARPPATAATPENMASRRLWDKSGFSLTKWPMTA